MQWIDTSAEEMERDRLRGVVAHPPPILGVNFRSPCNRYRVTVADHRAETWLLWDMTTAPPRVIADGFKSQAVAMRFGDGVIASRVLRVALRLATMARGAVDRLRRLTA